MFRLGHESIEWVIEEVYRIGGSGMEAIDAMAWRVSVGASVMERLTLDIYWPSESLGFAEDFRTDHQLEKPHLGD